MKLGYIQTGATNTILQYNQYSVKNMSLFARQIRNTSFKLEGSFCPSPDVKKRHVLTKSADSHALIQQRVTPYICSRMVLKVFVA